jgi:hypothetical protein
VKQENKSLLIKYIICFCVASLITVIVFWIKGFFVHSLAVNVQILADGFFISGIMLTMFAGLLFISSEGAFIGIGFVLRNVVQAFVPMGRKHHEFYGQYRERKLEQLKKRNSNCILITGLTFLIIGIIFNVIWYMNFYTVPV